MTKYLITDIEYDTDGEEIDLPTELEIEVPDIITSEEEELNDFIGDKISEITGFCHTGFVKQLVNEPQKPEPTHEVLDLTYHPDEGQGCFAGNQQECNDFVSEQSDYFMYRVVPIIKIPISN